MRPFDITDKDKVIASFEEMVAALPEKGVILPVKKVLTEPVKELLLEITKIDSSPLCISIALGCTFFVCVINGRSLTNDFFSYDRNVTFIWQLR